MKKYLILLGLFLGACTRYEQPAPTTLQDEVIEMNWNYAVKDLYWIEADPELSRDLTKVAPSVASIDFALETPAP